jgi:hypothetical protein
LTQALGILAVTAPAVAGWSVAMEGETAIALYFYVVIQAIFRKPIPEY